MLVYAIDYQKLIILVEKLILKENLDKIGLFKVEINFHSEVRAQISITIDKIEAK